MRRKHSISLEALLVVLPLVILAMVVLSFIGYTISKNAITKNINSQMELSLSSSVEKMRISLAKNQKVSELLAEGFGSVYKDISEENYQRMLISFVNKNTETFGAGIWFEPYAADKKQQYFSRYCFRENGGLTYVQDYSLGEGVYYTDQDWYTSVIDKQGESDWSSAYYDSFVKISMVTSSSPIYDKSGNFIGVATTDMDLTGLQEAVVSLKPNNSSRAFLIDSQGTYIADEDSSKLLSVNITNEENASLAELGSTILSNKTGTGSYKDNGENYKVWYTEIPECGWYLAIATPEVMLYSSISSIGSSFIRVCVILAFIAAALIAVYFRLRISLPLKKLYSATKEIEEGNLDVKISHVSNNELGEVSASVNNTAQRLSLYIDYIAELTDIINRIADGNLNYNLKLDYSGEFTKLKLAIENLKTALTDILLSINQTADEVAAGAQQVASGQNDLSLGTVEQAGSASNLVEVIGQIETKVSNTANSSLDAKNLNHKAMTEIKISNQSMKMLVAKMDEIVSSSYEIKKINKMIDDIAFQTNILALNAAVEAARAGSSGRGFSVVAEEVRNLAYKSSEASKNTEALIENSLRFIEEGRSITISTEKSLNMIENDFGRVVTVIDEISSDTENQLSSIMNVKKELSGISAVIQANSAAVLQSAAATEELHSQSVALKELAGRFKFDFSEGI